MATRTGDAAQDDFALFYDATWARTVACAYAVTGELGAAEEIAQEAYTRAWPRWKRLTAYEEPAAWVRRVATRLARSRGPELVPGPDADAVASPGRWPSCPAVAPRSPPCSVTRSIRAEPARPDWRTPMPEHRNDQLDLEATFTRLTQEVERRSTRPGPGFVARRARRRCACLVASLAAAAGLIASVAGGTLLTGSGRDVPVAGPSTSTAAAPSPALEPEKYRPTPLTLARLEQASLGWVQGWERTESGAGINSCVAQELSRVSGGPPHVEERFRAGDQVRARFVRQRLATYTEAAERMAEIQQAISECDDWRGTAFVSGYPSADEMRIHEFGTGDRGGLAFLVLAGNRLSVFTVVGAPTPYRSATGWDRGPLADALYQDLQAW